MSVSFTEETVLQVAPGNLSSNLEDETVILDVDKGVYYGMNPVAAFVWQCLESPSPFGSVRDAIIAEFDVDRDICERDLAALLSNLVEAGLVHVHRQAA